MAVTAVTSNYNVRRRKQSTNAMALPDERQSKRTKLDKRHVFTPPASPEAMDMFPGVQSCYDEDYEDPVLIGILDFLQRCGVPAMCSREISEGLLAEGKVQLSGATPSTMVDASIKQHHKRCTSMNRSNIIRKVADPRFPRKTLYHLATVDPFGPTHSMLSPAGSVGVASPAGLRVLSDRESEASDSGDDCDYLETLSNDGQGPFAASLDTRRRMSLSSSSELEFSLSIEDSRRVVAAHTPAEHTSPNKEQLAKLAKQQQLNIALPPSPFITPQASDDEPEHEATLKLPGISHVFTNSPLIRSLDYTNDFQDVDVQSPEAVTLDDLDCLLGF